MVQRQIALDSDKIRSAAQRVKDLKHGYIHSKIMPTIPPETRS